MVIQRSWKILSDAGSTSASSTEANRSPSALHSSSDDSNCSNQTTHSMVTSVASPPVAAKQVDASAAPSAEPVKFVTTSHMAETMLHRLRQRLGPIAGSSATSESAMRSLELLRISVQSAFDKEIDVIVKRFMESYFKPAFNNIKENLGQSAVSEDTLQKMSCALLENSKSQYNAFRTKPQSAAFLTTHPLTGEHAVRAIKRPATKASACANDISSKKLFTTIPTVSHAILQAQPSGPVKAPSLPVLPASTLAQQKTPAAAAAPARRQIFWNTALISTTTKFVLDVQANQAFGFGTDGKERLASKHPELIRYLPDSEDRDWLTAQNIIAQQNRNSRFLFLLHDEVCRLQQTHEAYRTKPNVDLDFMHTFTVPEFMIQKMKLFFVDLNIKSRGLITNSFSVSAATVQSNSHLRNALLQGVQSTTTVNGNAAASGGSVPETTSTQAAPANNVTTTSGSDSTGASSTLLKPKTSALSSSHATLTALLNNSTGTTPNDNAASKPPPRK